MKNTNLITLLLFSILSSAHAESDLTTQLDDLKIPGNVAPSGITSDKLYVVQNRLIDLNKRFEFTFGGAKNFTGNGMLQMTQLNAGVVYHLNNRFSLGLSGSYGFNDFSESANRLLNQAVPILPDAAVVKWRSDLLLSYNVFYGKFRVSMDQVFYFDQYVSVGPGVVNTQFNTVPAAVADVGFALWFGKNWSAKFGAKNTLFQEQKITSKDMAYHLLGHIEVGYLLGGEDRVYE